MLNQLTQIIQNAGTLGAKKLGILAAIGIGTMAVILIGAMYINKPGYSALYVGLEHDDVSRMGIVLADAGIAYDVNVEGNSVLVPAGQVANARMLLAEKGLPSSSTTGYELFDNLGSLGLTAFMQEITRVRALEGEIARSVQAIDGVKAARVHLVMGENGNFRREQQDPTASVLVRYNGARAEATANSIRYLVSAAVPSLSTENVTVLDSSGRLLAAGDDPLGNSAGNNLGIKANVETQVISSIERALTPYLGASNFRVSVQADISTDQRQTEETIFDPDSRVERSVQIVRSENSSAQNTGTDQATVEQNLVETANTAAGSGNESEKSERREETTNYELNSKKTAVISNGYSVNRLSVAVIVNRESLVAQNPNATPEEVNAKLEEIKQLASAASGLSEARNDNIELTAVNFLPVEALVEPVSEGITAIVGRQLGTVINALAFLTAVVLAVLFGVRPAISALTAQPAIESAEQAQASLEDLTGAGQPQLTQLGIDSVQSGATALGVDSDKNALIAKMRPEPADRLAMIVDLDDQRAAAILRRWVSEEAA